MQETKQTQVRSLGQEDPLQKEMATHPGIVVGNPMDRRAWQAKEPDTTIAVSEQVTHES